ncbi:MAG: ABC transporter ATP-binding protein [Lachnospiraceae bacterium]|nr:ABC transporter ATP-binding protein [Lachnospiraceae bacterium]
MKDNTKKQTARSGPYTKAGMLAHFLHGSKRFFIACIISSFIVTLLELLIPQVIRQTVDSVIGDAPINAPGFILRLIDSAGGAAYFREHLELVALIILVLALLVGVFVYLRSQTTSVAAERLSQKIREDLFSHIQRLPFSWHMENKTGDIIQRCTSDAERIRTFVSDQLISVFRILLLVGFSLYFMFSMNLQLSLVAAIAAPIIVTYSVIFRVKISKNFEACDNQEGVLSTIAQENLTGVRVVRAFGRENFERDRFEKQNEVYTSLWVHLIKLLSYFWAIGDTIGGLQVLLVLVLGSVMCVNGTLTAGELIAFITYNSMMIWPVRQLGRVISEMSKAGVSIDRIRYIMNSEPEQDRPDAVSSETAQQALRGDIEFDHVSFGYDSEKEILHDISFRIKAGTTLGILGSTGSGKSTLMHLLDRLYDLPEGSGRISIGGVDIRDMKAADLRRGIGMVLQEPFLFSRTISENIGIIDRNIPEEDIRRAADIACVDETISEFTNGYDTMVGERGVTLSGGQKQRTAIARMLTQKAPIMVFDDSLSAVDAETDARIRSRLAQLLGTATVILISHRVTTLMQADQIIVMEKGRITESGTPEELRTSGGLYQRISELQLEDTDKEVG